MQLDGDGVGAACEADTDLDGVPDDEDNCREVHNPQQLDNDGNEIGLRCDAGELRQLEGLREEIEMALAVDWMGGPDLPVRPCMENCPDWLSEDTRTFVEIDSETALDARIVDDRGFVVGKGEVDDSGVVRVEVKPDQSYQYCSPLQSGDECPRFDGRGYELQLSSEEAGFGDPVSADISVRTEQEVATDQ